MRLLNLVILFLVVVSVAEAKSDKVKFGKIEKSDLEMTVYPKDSSASAVILYENGYSEIDYDQTFGWNLKFTKHQRIKILKKEGVDYANFEIFLNVDGSDAEELTRVKAITFNLENGKIIKDEIKNKDIYLKKVNKYCNTKSFSLPNVKVGSVLDVQYTINCKAFFRNMRPWMFQHSIPAVYSEYQVRVPDYFKFREFVLGFESFFEAEKSVANTMVTINNKVRSGGFGLNSAVQTNFESYSVDVKVNDYLWIAKDMPAFKEEAFISTADNYIQQVQFELQSVQFPYSRFYPYSQSWESINTKLKENDYFGNVVFGPSRFLQETVDGLIAGVDDDLEKVAVLLRYVHDNYKFTGQNSIYSDGLRHVEKNRSGNVADLNFLLAAYLKLAGIDAKPVVLSTRSNGIFVFPTVTGFNYVVIVCNIDGKNILLDATDKNCGINEVPFKCLNGRGLIVGGENPGWVDFSEVGKSDERYVCKLTVDSNGGLKGVLDVARSGYEAQAFRNAVGNYGSQEKYKENFQEKNHDWEIESHDIKGIDALSGRVTEKMNLSVTNKSTFAGDMIYVSPLIFNVYDENPFKLKERKYPVDFGCTFKETEMVSFTIPEGYAVEEMPKSHRLTLAGTKASYLFSVTKLDANHLNVVSILSVKKSVLYAEDYEALKEFFNMIVDAGNQQIVLKKI